MAYTILWIVSTHSEQKANLNHMRSCVKIMTIITCKCLQHISKYLSLIKNKNIWRFHFLFVQTRNRTYDNGSEYLFTLKINKYIASICSILTNRLLDSSKIKYDFYIDEDSLKQLSPEKHAINIIISEKNKCNH